jgi:AraC family transcriptional regulator of adaptative response/methylated-DNA-[protein]-cysteine methyltransferase
MTAHATLLDTPFTAHDARRTRPVDRDTTPASTREVLRYSMLPCSLGRVLIAMSAHGIIALFLGSDDEELHDALAERFPAAALEEGGAEMEAITAQVVAFVDSPAEELNVPLDIRGTAFQQSVWGVLRKIPPGTTASYREIAEQIGRPAAVRAVAQACGANPIAIIVPCHRVVRSDGAISGYHWGVERKRALLAREAAAS